MRIRHNLDPGSIFDFQEVGLTALHDERVALEHRGVSTRRQPLLVPEAPENRVAELLCKIGLTQRFSSKIRPWLNDDLA